MKKFIIELTAWDYSYQLHDECITVPFPDLATAETFIRFYKSGFPDLDFTWCKIKGRYVVSASTKPSQIESL